MRIAALEMDGHGRPENWRIKPCKMAYRKTASRWTFLFGFVGFHAGFWSKS